MLEYNSLNTLNKRFRGFYPVVIDIETAGFNAKTDALLELGMATFKMDNDGWLYRDKNLHFHVKPFEGSILNQKALKFTGINPHNPLRKTVTEFEALNTIFEVVHRGIKDNQCNRAILVAHNATFDHNFMMAATERTGLRDNPFHQFATFDTATLSGLVLGQTVLAKACKTAGLNFDNNQAHSALYDSEQTAVLFCELVNRWKRLGGWPIQLHCHSK